MEDDRGVTACGHWHRQLGAEDPSEVADLAHDDFRLLVDMLRVSLTKSQASPGPQTEICSPPDLDIPTKSSCTSGIAALVCEGALNLLDARLVGILAPLDQLLFHPFRFCSEPLRLTGTGS